jgi:hypothetical protein
VRTELLSDSHIWLRLADPAWDDPLDPSFAAARGGRWNPPDSFPTLYLNEDRTTARINLRAFITGWPYEPEDLADDAGPVLVAARLPRRQRVADCHSREGVRATGLPATYPLDDRSELVGHERCQPIGQAAKNARLRGVRYRSAREPDGAGRELAWFPATARSRARLVGREAFTDWYYG